MDQLLQSSSRISAELIKPMDKMSYVANKFLTCGTINNGK